MSCYFRHLADVFEEAGLDLEAIKADKESKKEIDEKIHALVGVEYKDCSPTWKKVKELLAEEGGRERLVRTLRS